MWGDKCVELHYYIITEKKESTIVYVHFFLYLCSGYYVLIIMVEILKYCIPALCVLLATWLVMHKFYKSEAEKRLWELKRLAQKEISPLRMRAYERLALLLERTTPEHMLMDVSLVEMTPLQLQAHLMQTIRQEYDHNLSQQVYVSDELWGMIENARIQTVAFINTIAQQLPADSSALDYAKTLITAFHSNGDTPNELAMNALKKEAQALM